MIHLRVLSEVFMKRIKFALQSIKIFMKNYMQDNTNLILAMFNMISRCFIIFLLYAYVFKIILSYYRPQKCDRSAQYFFQIAGKGTKAYFNFQKVILVFGI